MRDFTSALYLGLRHGSGELRGWGALSGGRPAALAEPEGAPAVARALAALVGCERATLLPSTLHACWDLFALLADARASFHVDAGAYPIARWGVERAVARGATARRFAHHDPAALRRSLLRDRGGATPVVVTDGLCPRCGGAAPLAAYLEAVRPRGGRLVVDDTQALGILGRRGATRDPYGAGGGGTLRFAGVGGEDVVVVGSLAKGFGAPLAALAGAGALVARFEARSETRTHCSPPSVAAVRAAERALWVNEAEGDARRGRLARLVLRLRRGLAGLGLAAAGRLFPVQTLAPVPGCDAALLHARLLRAGVRAVPLRRRGEVGPRLAFLLTAAHGPSDVDEALEALAGAVGRITRGLGARALREGGRV